MRGSVEKLAARHVSLDCFSASPSCRVSIAAVTCLTAGKLIGRAPSPSAAIDLIDFAVAKSIKSIAALAHLRTPTHTTSCSTLLPTLSA